MFEIIGKLFHFSSISILILGAFILLKRIGKIQLSLMYVLCMLLFELLVIVVAYYLSKSTSFLFLISYFIHFVFLSIYYFQENLITKKYKRIIIGLGLLPLLLYIIPNSLYQSYGRVFYSFIIMLYSLFYVLYIIQGKIKIKRPQMVLNSSILLFFTIDTFLTFGTSYLIDKERLSLVSWFWSFRAILLQLFYVSLIYYGWKNHKIK
jgi:hypothetical protein